MKGPLARPESRWIAGDQLLAGTALPLDEHRRVRGGHLADDLLHALHRLRVPDQLVDGQLLAEARAKRLDLLITLGCLYP